nr:MAG TPA: hypothetical protein [Caudoviricetes sp.]
MIHRTNKCPVDWTILLPSKINPSIYRIISIKDNA